MASNLLAQENSNSSSFDKEFFEIKALSSAVPKKALKRILTIEDSFKQSELAPTSKTIFELSLLKGVCYLQLNDLDKASEHFSFCLEHAESRNNIFQQTQTINLQTKVEFRKNELKKVVINGNKALSLAKEINAFEEQAIAYNNIGMAYGALYAYEDSLNALLLGLELKDYLDSDLMYYLNNNTSNVYFYLGHFSQALDTLKQATHYIDSHENPRMKILSDMNFGKIYAKLQQMDTATQHLEKAKELAEKNPEHFDLLTGVYEDLSEHYLAQDVVSEAKEISQKALDLARSSNNISSEAYLLVTLAKCHMRENEHALSLEALNTAFNLLQSDAADKTQLKIHQAYVKQYEHLGDYKAALEHHKRFYALQQEIHDERSRSRMQGMMIKHDTERLQSEHDRLANEKELASLRLLKLEQDNLKLIQENTRDGLTGAYNRRYLNEKFSEVFELATKNQSPLSVMMSDIDFFKQVNDTYSHAIGDEVLRAIARIFMDNTREQDTVARYGGEEFVVIFDRTHKGTAITVAEKLRVLIQDYPWHEIHPELKITISIGISSGTDYPDYEAMLNHADKYMYTAKRSGKNQVQYE